MQHYEKYILPGNRPRSLIFGEHDFLVQEIPDGVLLHEFCDGQLVREKTIKEISNEETPTLKHLGRAEGEDLPHCLFVAYKRSKDFLDLATAYRRQYPVIISGQAVFDFYA
jgi:hypothetical protein